MEAELQTEATGRDERGPRARVPADVLAQPRCQIRLRAGCFRGGRVPTSPRSGGRTRERIRRSHPGPALPCPAPPRILFPSSAPPFPTDCPTPRRHRLRKAPTSTPVFINLAFAADLFFLNELYFGNFSPNRLQNSPHICGENQCFSVAGEQTKSNTPFPGSPASSPHPRERSAQDAGGRGRPGGCLETPGAVGGPVQGARGPLRAHPRRPGRSAPASAPLPRSSRPAGLQGLPRLVHWPPAPPVPGRSSPAGALPPPPLRVQKAPEKAPRARCAPSAFPAGHPSRPGAPASRSLPLLPTGKSQPRIPCGRPLTTGPARRCLRLRRALTNDSRCVRRPH